MAGMLLAIHAAVALASAILVYYGVDTNFKDHNEAAKALRKLCKKHKIESDGIKHFEQLLKLKTPVSYGSTHYEVNEANQAHRSVSRFENWANRSFVEVMRA